MDFFLSAIRQYADFKGRCSRRPFWLFIVTTHVCLMLLATPFLMSAVRVLTTLLVERSDFMDFAESLVLQGRLDHESFARLLATSHDTIEECAAILLSEHVISMSVAALAVLFGLFLVVPTLSITVRRVRDAGQSPWWVYASLVAFVPLPGVAELGTLLCLVVFVLCCLPSKQGEEVTKDKIPA